MTNNHADHLTVSYSPRENIELEDGEAILEVETLKPTKEPKNSTFVHIDFDEILHQLGGFSYWHWLNFILLSLSSAIAGLVILTYSFTGKGK